MRHLFYIPSHRRSAPAIESLYREASFIHKHGDTDLSLAVIEAVEAPFVRDHARLLDACAEAADVRIYHLPVSGVRSLLDVIIDAVASSEAELLLLRKLLLPSGISYGAGPNKAALLGAALGVDALHRRDSDTVVSAVGEKARFPGELEVEAIGQRVGGLNVTNEVRNPDSRTLVVASAYAGDPPLDRQALMRCDPAFGRRIERLADPGATDDELDRSIREYFVDEPNRRYDDDFFEIDRSGKTEMGVSCVSAVWRELPEMPIQDTLGGDYMQKNLMYRFRVPVVFHSRKVEHVFTEDRRSPTVGDAADYALRDLRYLILWRIWSAHNRTLQSDPATYWSEPHNLDQTGYASSFTAAARTVPTDELVEIVHEFAAVHAEAANFATGADQAAFTEIARQVEAHRSLVDEVRDGIADYVFLVIRWPDLLKAAEDVPAELLDTLRVT